MYTTIAPIIMALWMILPAFSSAQTQLEMNMEAKRRYEAADKELNRVYRQILSSYKTDEVFITNLKKAQRLWIQWRDAEMKVRYPDREAGHYGSIHPYCWNTYLAELTAERTKKLSVWTKGVAEGDGCAGSVKVSSN